LPVNGKKRFDVRYSLKIGLLIAAFAIGFCRSLVNADDFSGIYSNGDPTFDSTIEINQVSKHRAFVDVEINAPSAGSSCGGEVSGPATIHRNHLTVLQGDPPDQCKLIIEVENMNASVVSAVNCTDYEGAACAFEEQAINLKKVTSPKRSINELPNKATHPSK
jgi:hypothetical protein